MRKGLPTLLLCFLATVYIKPVQGQYCIPVATPYNQDMPGIRQVVLNTIDRISADLENFPQSSYVNTGLSTTLQKGNTYTMSVNTSVDASICPDMNIRVWIDFNQDFDLSDVGETVISADHQPPGTYTGSFTVPATALGGPTRMRVTSKMTNLGGHSLPTPCDDPADILGYHGEFEDYTVEIQGTTAIDPLVSALNSWDVQMNEGSLSLHYNLSKGAMVSLELYNLIGEKVIFIDVSKQNSGEYYVRQDIKSTNASASRFYIAVFTVDGQISSRKIFLND